MSSSAAYLGDEDVHAIGIGSRQVSVAQVCFHTAMRQGNIRVWCLGNNGVSSTNLKRSIPTSSIPIIIFLHFKRSTRLADNGLTKSHIPKPRIIMIPLLIDTTRDRNVHRISTRKSLSM
ncbi:predicted protein [Lichtheimia corymbifera JMRC:FSU:9682]|uniref:Uncharacterized protein n=1 Tax=Lichtheimia corymbifera JMRC:FSU:9682 TaxID=1263082 RepID=A0A068SAK8_9FUNG|nr:predicted protein [Lichtheimia corymbifera JMRC:FSU:9682]